MSAAYVWFSLTLKFEKFWLFEACMILSTGIVQLIGHICILTVVLETSMKDRLMRGNHFKCKLFPSHEPPPHARSSPTVRIRIRSNDLTSLSLLALDNVSSLDNRETL